MFDDITGAVDEVSDMLGGGEEGDSSVPDVPPTYKDGGPIDRDREDAPGSTAVGVPNVYDTALPVKFIHFGWVHEDRSRSFNHASRDDLSVEPLPEDVPTRGVMFRAAAEREAILLRGFAQSTQNVIAAYGENAGALGGLADMAGDLMGGGDEGPALPDPAPYAEIMAKVEAAGGLVNKDTIRYADTHKAGLDLHKARASYAALAEGTELPEDGGDSGGLPGPTDLIPDIPGSEHIKTAIGIATKPIELWVDLYMRVRTVAEPAIEEVCYNLTMSAVRESTVPIFPLWFPPPEPSGEGEGDDDDDDDSNPIEDALEPVTGAVEDAQNEVEGFRNDVQEFISGTREEGPGSGPLTDAFAAMKETPPAICQAFLGPFGLDSLPEFIDRIITELALVDIGFLELAYSQIMADGGQKAIDKEILLAGGREYMSNRILGILTEFIPFLAFLQDDEPLGSMQGISVAGSDFGRKLTGLLSEGLGPAIDPIIDYASGNVHEELESLRKAAKEGNYLTMEVFLGRLPYLTTVVFRDTFFPIWELLIKKVFEAIGGPMGDVLGAMTGVMDKIKGVVDAVGDVLDTVNAVTDKLAEGVSLDDIGDADPFGLGGDDDGGGEEESGGSFPGDPRITEGEALAVEKSEVDEAEEPEPIES